MFDLYPFLFCFNSLIHPFYVGIPVVRLAFLPILRLLPPSAKLRSQGVCSAQRTICVLPPLSLSLVTARAQMLVVV